MVGVGRGAHGGVLIKNAEALERMEKIDTLVVDKTGTLTEGKPSVTAIVPAPGFQEDDILQLAASVERASEHPLADAIVRAAKQRGLEPGAVEGFDSPTGKGATGKVGGKSIVLGNANYLTSIGIDTGSLAAVFASHVLDLCALALKPSREVLHRAHAGLRAARLQAIKTDILAHLGECSSTST